MIDFGYPLDLCKAIDDAIAAQQLTPPETIQAIADSMDRPSLVNYSGGLTEAEIDAALDWLDQDARQRYRAFLGWSPSDN